MARAARYFEGCHDFRNFSRLEPQQQGVPTCVVLRARVVHVDSLAQVDDGRGRARRDPFGCDDLRGHWWCPCDDDAVARRRMTGHHEAEEGGEEDGRSEVRRDTAKAGEGDQDDTDMYDGREESGNSEECRGRHDVQGVGLGRNFARARARRMCFFEVCGSAFLWHQVRNMMGVLFAVGRGVEEPEVVRRLLDVRAGTEFGGNLGRPGYLPASDLPLVLWHCHYAGLSGERWFLSQRAAQEVNDSLEREWSRAQTRLAFWSGAIQRLRMTRIHPLPPPLPSSSALLPGSEVRGAEGVCARSSGPAERARALITAAGMEGEEGAAAERWFRQGGEAARATVDLGLDGGGVNLRDAHSASRALPPPGCPLLYSSTWESEVTGEEVVWGDVFEGKVYVQNDATLGPPTNGIARSFHAAEHSLGAADRDPSKYVPLTRRGRDATLADRIRTLMRKKPHGAGVGRSRHEEAQHRRRYVDADDE